MTKLNRREGPDVPTYLEAYPRLDSRAVSRALMSDLVAWSWNDQSGRVGTAYVTRDDATTVRIRSFFWNLRYLRLAPQDLTVEVADETSPKYNGYSIFLCPSCKRRCRTIVYGFRWSCRYCAELRHKSGWLKEQGTAWSRLKALNKILQGGKVDGQWSTTHLRNVAEREKLRRRFKAAPFVTPGRLQNEVVAQLQQPDADDPDWLDPTSWPPEGCDEDELRP